MRSDQTENSWPDLARNAPLQARQLAHAPDNQKPRRRTSNFGLLSLTLLCLLGAAPSAGAQSPALLLEVARDPGRADAPLTARSLALGGARAALGGAEDALANPASLTRGPAMEVVFAGGSFQFGRDELSLTPRQQPPFQSQRGPSPRSNTLPLFVAAAFRREGLGGAVFVDASDRLAHQFTTGRNVLRASAISGISVQTSASGAASLTRSLTRLGGALAIGTRNGRVSIGATGYLGRFDANVAATLDVESHSRYYGPYPPSESRRAWQNRSHVQFADWAPGFVLAGAVRPAEPVTVSGRWAHAQPFESIRTYVNDDLKSPFSHSEPVTYRPPDVVAIAVAATGGRTSAVVEITRTAYADVYGPASPPLSPFASCQILEDPKCAGWGFGEYVAANSTGLRAGVERALTTGPYAMRLRGGLSFDQAYTLARPKGDPNLNARQGPAPTVSTPFTPPRENSWIWSIGWAMGSPRIEIGMGLALGSQQQRLVAEIRIRSSHRVRD